MPLPAQAGLLKNLSPRRERIPIIELFIVGTGLRACPMEAFAPVKTQDNH